MPSPSPILRDISILPHHSFVLSLSLSSSIPPILSKIQSACLTSYSIYLSSFLSVFLHSSSSNKNGRWQNIFIQFFDFPSIAPRFSVSHCYIMTRVLVNLVLLLLTLSFILALGEAVRSSDKFRNGSNFRLGQELRYVLISAVEPSSLVLCDIWNGLVGLLQSISRFWDFFAVTLDKVVHGHFLTQHFVFLGFFTP